MQFIKDGPHVPDRLVQAHEDGRVVFFCGAGVSFPAGLPGFGGLVDKIYEAVGEYPSAVERNAIKNRQHDTAIGLLEKRLAGGRAAMRRYLPEILEPKKEFYRTHRALLTLSRTRGRQPRCRLVTTNYDRLFEAVRAPTLPVFQAPCLPPAKTRWHGLVYLHGLLPDRTIEADAEAALDQLILSSGDFGLAYLTEGWAARFAAELFRSFIVCFIGYSISDPVLRYMMDALAADGLRGEDEAPEAFAFASYSRGKQAEAEGEWTAKNVTPILYREHRRHFYLRDTLREWAEIYRDGVLGKERIVVQYAMSRPVECTAQDDFKGRVIWAFSSDVSGRSAKRFAELDPAPPLDWLDVFAERRFGRQDLIRFGICPQSEPEKDFACSLLDRPGVPSRSSRMAPFQGTCRWDEVMHHLARWLVKHLDDPKLLLWCANRALPLDLQFAHLVALTLDRNPPKPPMDKLWRLMLADRVKRDTDFDFGCWRRRVKEHGLTLPARLQLREVLKPRIRFGESSRAPVLRRPPDEPAAISDLVNWDVVLGHDHAGELLKDLHRSLPPGDSLAPLLPEMTALLRDALDLMRELEGASDEEDPSAFWHPSIGEHSQNEHYRDWSVLIDLARDAWVATAETDPPRALLEIQTWLAQPYPLFRRLAFFGARDERVVAPEQALAWLLMDDGQWLWSDETKREAIRLMVTISPKLPGDQAAALQEAILRAYQRLCPHELTAEDLDQFAEHDIWLRLAKIEAAGAQLGTEARERLQELSRTYPGLALADDERDEFPYWRGDGSEWSNSIATPKERRELAAWLRDNPETFDALPNDHWRKRCTEDFATTATALCQLAMDGEWPAEPWRQALQVWSTAPVARNAFRRLGNLVSTAPDDTLKQLTHPLARWLQAVAKDVGDDREPFVTLAKRTIALHRYDALDAEHDPVSLAINQPVGIVVQALFAWWHAQGLEDNQGIGNPIRPIFDGLCDPAVPIFRHGRVILAQRAVLLFRVDQAWTEQQVLPLFDWSQSADEARAAWCGFLWTAQAYLPLLAALKPQLLATANHYDGIGEFGHKYAALVTLAALDPSDWITRKEIAPAIRALPEDGLIESLRFATRALQSADEQGNEYWEHRIKPFLKEEVWPKSRDVFSAAICDKLVELCAASGDCFPDAVDIVVPWLQPQLEASDLALRSLAKAGLCGRFPSDALSLLHTVVNPQGGNAIGPNYLSECLNAIVASDPALVEDHRTRHLRGFY